MSTSKIDLVKIPRDKDGRYALRKEDETKVLEDLKTMSRAEVGAKWGISRTKIFWLLNPGKYKEQLEKNKLTKTYDKDKAKLYKRANRKKKYAMRDALEKKNTI